MLIMSLNAGRYILYMFIWFNIVCKACLSYVVVRGVQGFFVWVFLFGFVLFSSICENNKKVTVQKK